MRLQKSQRLKLTDAGLDDTFQVEVHLQCPSAMDVDVSCFGLDGSGKLSDERYMIFYNQPTSPCGGVALRNHNSKPLCFEVQLSALPPTLERLEFSLTVDGEADIQALGSSRIAFVTDGVTKAEFLFDGSMFANEKALMIARLYRKDMWRMAAVAQGFSGGLAALLQHFGGTLAADEAEPPPKIEEPISPTLTLRKQKLQQKILSLEKKNPQLAAQLQAVQLCLEKKKIDSITARVAVVLDATGSMRPMYRNGTVKRAFERMVAVASCLDDDGMLDVWIFSKEFRRAPSVSVDGYEIEEEKKGWFSTSIQRVQKGLESFIPEVYGTPKWGNNEPPCMLDVIQKYTVEDVSEHPALILFFSDGGVSANRKIATIIREASDKPIFWQFVGLGNANYGVLEKLDNLEGRVIDNANFFALDDIDKISNKELYDRLLDEFPDWLQDARQHGIIK